MPVSDRHGVGAVPVALEKLCYAKAALVEVETKRAIRGPAAFTSDLGPEKYSLGCKTLRYAFTSF